MEAIKFSLHFRLPNLGVCFICRGSPYFVFLFFLDFRFYTAACFQKHWTWSKSTPLGLMLFSGFPNVCNCVFIAQGFRKLLGLFSVSYIEMQMSFLLSNIYRSRWCKNIVLVFTVIQTNIANICTILLLRKQYQISGFPPSGPTLERGCSVSRSRPRCWRTRIPLLSNCLLSAGSWARFLIMTFQQNHISHF